MCIIEVSIGDSTAYLDKVQHCTMHNVISWTVDMHSLRRQLTFHAGLDHGVDDGFPLRLVFRQLVEVGRDLRLINCAIALNPFVLAEGACHGFALEVK